RCDDAVALDHAQHGEPTVDHAFLSNGCVSVLAIDNNTPSSPSWNSGHAAERQSAMLTSREHGRGQGHDRRGFSCGLRLREPGRSDETKEVRMPEYARIRGSRRQLWFGGLVLLVLSAAANMASPLYPLLQETYGMSETTMTGLYATYVLSCLPSLLLFGSAADAFGRKPVLLAAIGLVVLGTAGFGLNT